MPSFRCEVAACVCLVFASVALADEPKLTKAEVAKRVKPAVAFVVAKVDAEFGRARTSQGSAFCVHSSGLFITNEHVIHGTSAIDLVVNPAQKDEKVYKAKVLRKDEKVDLALLQVEGKDSLITLPLGDSSTLEELTDVIACGYPFGSALSFGTKDYPSITTTSGAVSSLRRKDNQLELIQLDVSLNPGNSGGPVLDMKGKVIGVVVSGIRGTNVNFAIPVQQVMKFLTKPEFTFTVPVVRSSDRGKPISVEAKLLTFTPDASNTELELQVRTSKEAVVRYRMKQEKETYKAEVVLLPDGKETKKCKLDVSFLEGSLSAPVADRTVKIGNTTYSLSKLHTITPAKGEASLVSGERLEGQITGLEAIPFHLGGKEVSVDLSAARGITVNTLHDTPIIFLDVVARHGGNEVGRVSRRLILEDSRVYLSELQPFATQTKAWPLTAGKIGGAENTQIQVNGVGYPKGLGQCASDPPATATYRLSKTADLFLATVAFDDTNNGTVTGPTTFEVYGDGKLLWKSKIINSFHQTDDCLVDVSGVDVLEIRVGHKGNGFAARAVWVDPTLIGSDTAAIRRAAKK